MSFWADHPEEAEEDEIDVGSSAYVEQLIARAKNGDVVAANTIISIAGRGEGTPAYHRAHRYLRFLLGTE